MESNHEEKITYKSAGVDTEAGRDFVGAIKEKVHSTFSNKVLGGLGGFSAAYDVSFLKEYAEPVLLSCTDGVGTKLELARLLDKHDTIGIDLVAMCVNDLIVNGGKPMFFLDYIACGKLDIAKMNDIVTGIVEGCKQAGTSLVGGETAEHPGVMDPDEYDIAGFCVGAVEKSKLIDGSAVHTGDVLIGLESSGLHSNGFSLVRKLLLKDGKLPSDSSKLEFIRNFVMQPTRIYVSLVLSLLEKYPIHGMVHVTGGGYYENIPRVLKENQAVEIIASNLPRLPVYETLQKEYQLDHKDMFGTFNMGIGYILIVPASRVDELMNDLVQKKEKAIVMGKVVTKTTNERVLFN